MTYPFTKHIRFTAIAMAIALSAIPAMTAASGARITFPRSSTANIGIVIRDLSTGENTVSLNEGKLLTPASILKCVTAAAVLLDGKENYTFPTECSMSGVISRDGVLYGDITVAGSGDPTLEYAKLDGCGGVIDSIADAIKSLGTTAIAGCLQVDSITYPLREPGALPKWEVEDLKWSYGAGLYPLNYRNNTEGIDRAVYEPVETFIDALEERLLRDSIKVEWNENLAYSNEKGSQFFLHKSPPAKAILREMMVSSNNLYAEGMLRTLAPGDYRAKALEREAELLSANGLDAGELVAFDGSGLTRNSKLTPRFMADLLTVMSSGEMADVYVQLFPKAGIEGTVKKLLKNTRLEGLLTLKSGSMNGVQCFAGYRIDQDGKPTHAIVIMINDFTCKRALVTKAITDFLLQQF